jgi:acyl carrier protein
MNEFLEQLADILEVEQVSPGDVLSGFDAWDSLAQLSIIALTEENYGVGIFASELKDTQTIEGLWELIESKRNS